MTEEKLQRYTNREINAVKELYLKGYGCRRIAAELKRGGFTPCPAEESIDLWVRKYGWAKLRGRLRRKSETKLVNTLADAKARQFEIVRIPQEFMLMRAKPTLAKLKAKEITLEEAEKKLKDIGAWDAVLGAMKHELLLWGEATDRIETPTVVLHTWWEEKKKKAGIIEEKKDGT